MPVNAFSTPGGYIYVSRGLFDLIGEDEDYALRFAVGHEIAHVDLNQCAQRVIESMQKNHLSAEQFDRLSIEEFGSPYGKEGELAALRRNDETDLVV